MYSSRSTLHVVTLLLVILGAQVACAPALSAPPPQTASTVAPLPSPTTASTNTPNAPTNTPRPVATNTLTPPTATAAATPAPTMRATTIDPVIVAAGDIACDPASSAFKDLKGTASACHMMAVSDLVLRAKPDAVLTLGDYQYFCGGYAAATKSYDPSWGRFKSITFPVVGNHEYLTSPENGVGTGCDDSNAAAAGYFKYYGERAGTPGKGYYSFDLGAWHLVALNTQCSSVGGCGAGSPQGKWLQADLEAHPTKCTLAFWHIPLWSSGGRANKNSAAFVKDLYDNDADLILTGHDHTYERFAPQDPASKLDLARGLREFVVGTGGADHTHFDEIFPNSEVRDDKTFGALKLTLHPTSYDWEFLPEPGGTFTDAGSQACH